MAKRAGREGAPSDLGKSTGWFCMGGGFRPPENNPTGKQWRCAQSGRRQDLSDLFDYLGGG